MWGGAYTVVLFASLGGVLFGFDQGNWSGAIVKEGFHATFCEREAGHECTNAENLPVKYQAFLAMGASMLQLGAVVGSTVVAPCIARSVGRRRTLFTGCLVTILGNSLQVVLLSYHGFVMARFIDGLGVGAVTYALPMYVSEISPPEVRGMLGCAMQLAMVLGMLLAAILNIIPDFTWQRSLTMPILPAVSLCVVLPFFPRSPSFALFQAQHSWDSLAGTSAARDALRQLRNKENVEDELTELIQHVVQTRSAKSVPWGHLYRDKSVWRRVLVAGMLQWMQQLTGINALLSYGPSFFDHTTILGENSAQMCACTIRTVNVVFTVVMMALIDRWGRRSLLLLGSVGMGVSLAMAGVAAYLPKRIGGFDAACEWGMLCCLCAYVASFAVGWGAVPWIYPSEIFPMHVKEKAMSTSCCSQWLANFLVVFWVPVQVTALKKHGTFWFYSVWVVLGFGLVYCFVPETKGLSERRIFALFGQEPPARRATLTQRHSRAPPGIEMGPRRKDFDR